MCTAAIESVVENNEPLTQAMEDPSIAWVVCVCVMERLLPQLKAWLIGAWCSVYTYTFANVQMCI